jgi:undecaprenyl-diphosphatase
MCGAALTLLALLSIFLIDAPLARAIAPFVDANRAFADPFVTVLEYAFGFPVSKFLTGFVLVVAGAALFAFRRPLARLLLYVGVAHLVSRLIAGVLKNVFLRARPYDANAGAFFVDNGSSFPSGHAAHFWALFFALALAFPRLRIPALILALLVSVSRVMVNDHFVGDVLGSAAICAFVCAALARFLLPKAIWTAVAPATAL